MLRVSGHLARDQALLGLAFRLVLAPLIVLVAIRAGDLRGPNLAVRGHTGAGLARGTAGFIGQGLSGCQGRGFCSALLGAIGCGDWRSSAARERVTESSNERDAGDCLPD